MKKTLVTILLTLGALFAVSQPESPKPISITAPTEKSIREEYRNEQKVKRERERLERATTAARVVYRRNSCDTAFAQLTAKTAIENGLSPVLLAAVVVSESSAKADSIHGNDIGLMQINTKVWKYSRSELKDPRRNMQIGARILAKQIRKFGLVEGLHRYNGLGCPDNTYANSVLARAGMKV